MTDAAIRLPTPTGASTAPNWRRSTPPELIRAFKQGDATKFARLLRRSPPLNAARRCNSAPAAHPCQQALWSQHAFPATERSRALAAVLASGTSASRRTGKWRARRAAEISAVLDQSSTGTALDGFELVAWLSILLSEQALPDELFLRVWSTLQASLNALLKTPPGLAGRLTTDQRTLLLGELPWSYGLVFATVQGARRARDQGAKHLKHELSLVCDADGVPQAALLPRLPLCLAPLTRASALSALVGGDWRDGPARRQYRRFVLRTASLLQPDGRTALSNGVVHQAASLLLASAKSAGLKESHRASLLAAGLAQHRPGRRERHRTSVAPRLKRKHRPSVQSDAAHLACLRNNWGVGADACIIAFDGPLPRIDFAAFGVPILAGEWGCSTRFGDLAPSPSNGKWECVCWFSDSTADYVELQWTATDGNRLLRKALLSRDDHFLMLCDVVHGTGGNGIDHTVSLPLQGEASARQDGLTREWALQRGPLTLRVVPLGLPQQTIDRADGRLSIDAHAITLRQSSAGPRLACPLLFDWSPVRRKSPAQWKQLTVADNGRILNAAESLGVRWRIGDAQWLYYHVLDGSDTARTVLGLHTFHETVIAEVDSSGDVHQILQVENESQN